MKNKETYINLVRITNAIGYQYVLRSTGVTIEDTPLLPGKVYDGDIEGYDLNYLPSKTRVYANWNGFGLPPNAIVQVDVESGECQPDLLKLHVDVIVLKCRNSYTHGLHVIIFVTTCIYR